MEQPTLTRHLSDLFALPERVIHAILLGRHPARIPNSTVWDIRQAAGRVLEGGPALPHAHVRRAPRFRTQTKLFLRFLDRAGKAISRGSGLVQDLSLSGVLVCPVRILKNSFPLGFHQLVVEVRGLKLNAKLARLEGEPVTSLAAEFVRMDWESRQALKTLMTQLSIQLLS